jgi:hypothetical protein
MKQMMHGLKREEISHKGGSLIVLVDVLPCGIRVQRENANWTHNEDPTNTYRIRGGTVWVSNRELEKRTDGMSKYMQCVDLFGALRQCIHIDARYAVPTKDRPTPEPGTDSADLADRIETGRGIALSALERKKLDSLEQKAVDTIQMMQADALKARRNEHMLSVATYYERALQAFTADSLGRPNPAVAAMLTGAGIGEAIARSRQVEKIDDRISTRQQVLHSLIEKDIGVFADLWEDIKEPKGTNLEGAIRRSLRCVRQAASEHATESVRKEGSKAIAEIRSQLHVHQERLKGVHAAPFRRNASHALEDIRKAIALCDGEHHAQLADQISLMRRGVQWVFALKEIHDSLLTPLSIQIEMYRLRCRHKNRQGIRNKFRIAFKDYLVQFSDHFEWVTKRLTVFEERLKRCDDEKFAKLVKKEVVDALKEARGAIAEHDWLAVERKLETIGHIL